MFHALRIPPTDAKARQSAPTAAKAGHQQPKRFATAFGSLLRLLPLAMATAIATGCTTACTVVSSAPVPCEVLSASGRWVGGYELLRFCDDGLLTIRSPRTGAVRQLPPERWRDPVEEALLEAATSQL